MSKVKRWLEEMWEQREMEEQTMAEGECWDEELSWEELRELERAHAESDPRSLVLPGEEPPDLWICVDGAEAQ